MRCLNQLSLTWKNKLYIFLKSVLLRRLQNLLFFKKGVGDPNGPCLHTVRRGIKPHVVLKKEGLVIDSVELFWGLFLRITDFAVVWNHDRIEHLHESDNVAINHKSIFASPRRQPKFVSSLPRHCRFLQDFFQQRTIDSETKRWCVKKEDILYIGDLNNIKRIIF